MSDYDHLAEQLRHPDNPIVFMEMTAGGAPIGTIKMELFADVCPKTAENFRFEENVAKNKHYFVE